MHAASASAMNQQPKVKMKTQPSKRQNLKMIINPKIPKNKASIKATLRNKQTLKNPNRWEIKKRWLGLNQPTNFERNPTKKSIYRRRNRRPTKM